VTTDQLDLILRDVRAALLLGTGNTAAGTAAAAAAAPRPTCGLGCSVDADGGVPADRLAVVVMASGNEEGRRRARSIRGTWWRWVSPGLGRMCADVDDDELGLATLPQLRGKGSYEDAQRRQTECLKWLWERDYSSNSGGGGGGGGGSRRPPRPLPAWYFLADDDTWVNVPLLRHVAARYDPDLPLLLGHVYAWPPEEKQEKQEQQQQQRKQKKITLGGGAGMLLSREAFRRMAPRMRRDDERGEGGPCAAAGFNDVTLPNCARALGVLRVHSELFDGHDRGRDPPNPNSAQIAVHRMTDAAQARALCCESSRRFGWGGELLLGEEGEQC
jgi:hypothetical protein